jgi:MoaA/NifB/PqqE/SkfB family radical SAM enzyme
MNERFHTYKILHHAFQERKTPIHIQMDLTGACNHRCPFCFWKAGDRNPGFEQTYIKNISMIKTEVALRALDEFRDAGIKAITLVGGGEPLIHKDIDLILERIIGNGMEYGVITNLSRLPRMDLLERATWIRVSADAADEPSYKAMHNPVHETFADLCRNIEAIAGKTDVGVSFLLDLPNWHLAFEAAKLFKGMGVNYIQYKPVYDETKGATIRPHLDEIETLLEQAEALADEGFDVINMVSRVEDISAPKRTFKKCQLVNYQMQMGVDGHLYPCCILKYQQQFSYGNMHEQSFMEIWDGERRKAVTETLTAQACPSCYYDRQNNLLHYLSQTDPKHVQFV